MASLILPQDNAVIDYSIISQLVNAINSLQTQVDGISAKSSVSVDDGTGKIVQKNIITKAGKEPLNGKSSTGNLNVAPEIKTLLGVVGTVYRSSSAPTNGMYCWISHQSGTEFAFSTNVKTPPANTSIHWIAVGYDK
jgi:hypothetical protein